MSELGIALTTSAIGMGLLFLALVVLYGLMYLMTALTGEGEQPSAGEQSAPRPSAGRRQAAAIGAALARAEAEMEAGAGLPVEGSGLTPWQAYHRHRLLELRTPPGRPRP